MKKNHLLNSKLITVLVCLFLTSVSFAKSQTFRATFTFTVPEKVTTSQLQDWDGGGTSSIADGSSDRNVENKYANWSYIGSGITLLPSKGFTIKNIGKISDSQNYTFAKKPNNGLITLPKGMDFFNLCGNYYRSAKDSQVFINDNLDSLEDKLYFWEHYETNYTYIDADYQGGYAALTLSSGTPPISPPGLSGRGLSGRVEKTFITVDQGLFEKKHGLFFEEANPSSNIMFRVANVSTVMATPNTTTDNNNDNAVTQDNFLKIRLGFNSANNYHRQILMGFMNEYATSGIDNGYDAFLLDDFPNDMYFLNGEAQLVIQGEGYFDANTNYPLGVKTGENGNVQFLLDDLINFDADQELYIYDAETEIYHDIKEGPFEINLPIGLYETRFSLRFINPNALLATADLDPKKLINIAFANSNNNLTIENNNKNLIVNTVTLFNILGQNLHTWELENESQTNMEIPIINYGTGTYVVKIQTSTGSVSKKIFIK